MKELKAQIEKKFNITINIGMGNNILLASLACLKCFIESIEKKNNENNIINDIKAIFEEDNNISNDLISVENNEKDILSFLNNFPLEYLSNSENKYFEMEILLISIHMKYIIYLKKKIYIKKYFYFV